MYLKIRILNLNLKMRIFKWPKKDVGNLVPSRFC